MSDCGDCGGGGCDTGTDCCDTGNDCCDTGNDCCVDDSTNFGYESYSSSSLHINDVAPVEHIVDMYDMQNVNDDGARDGRRKESGHWWSIAESLKFIKIMKRHKEELLNAKNRRLIWDKIHQEAVDQGIKVMLQDCQNKWKNLIRSFKDCCKNNRNQTKMKMRFKFFDEMKDYFGTESVIKLDHDYNDSGVTLYPLTSGNDYSFSHQFTQNPTVTFPPICFTDQQFIQYTKMKREEYLRKQKRHDEQMKIKKELLEVQKKQLEVMKKAAIAKAHNQNINFDFPCRWPDDATSKLISIITGRKLEMAEKDQMKKPALWREIQQEMTDFGYEVSIKECKMKWRNLTRTYNLRCRNQREKGFKFRFFEEMQAYYDEPDSPKVDPLVVTVYQLN